MKRLITLIPIFAFFISCGKPQESYFVYEVHDGDTFTINSHKIRLFGVDTPEISNQYDNFNPTENLEYIYAVEAKNFVSKLILNRSVKLQKITTDKYKRIVSKVIINGIDLAEELIKNGLARIAYFSTNPLNPFYSNDYEYYKKLTHLQKQSYDRKIGIWSNPNAFKIIFPKS